MPAMRHPVRASRRALITYAPGTGMKSCEPYRLCQPVRGTRCRCKQSANNVVMNAVRLSRGRRPLAIGRAPTTLWACTVYLTVS